METKSILQWLEEIPHPEIRERAIKNYHAEKDEQFLSKRRERGYGSFADAIDWSFYWDTTPEGHNFWSDVYGREFDKALALLTPPSPSELEVAIGLLKKAQPYIHDVQKDNVEDRSVGIFEDAELSGLHAAIDEFLKGK